MEVYTNPKDFISAQLVSTRDISAGPWNDWFTGDCPNIRPPVELVCSMSSRHAVLTPQVHALLPERAVRGDRAALTAFLDGAAMPACIEYMSPGPPHIGVMISASQAA